MTSSFPSDDRIRDLLRGRIEASGRALGGVIGVVDASGARTIEVGRAAAGGPPVGADTLFELGCVTKVLTGLLCAEMIERREIALADPISPWLPADVPAIGRNGVPISLEHLITHTSGLPHHAVDVYDPVERLFDLLRACVPRQDVGTFYEYSTAGYSVLGHVLEQRTGRLHQELVGEMICTPLDMGDTVVEPPPEAAPRLAASHDAGLQRIGPFGAPTLTGGYGFHSTAADLLRLLAACTGHVRTPLEAAIAQTAAARRPGAPGFEDVAMAWYVSRLNGSEAILHDGSSLGHRAFLGYTRTGRRGVVALLNSVAPVGVTDICRHLLNPAYPILPNDSVLLQPPRGSPPAAALDQASLERYAGLYQLTPNCRVAVTCEAGGLDVSDGRETRRLIPLNEREFWLPASAFRPDGMVRFEFDGDRRAAAMTVPDRGFQRRLVRVEGSVPPVWHGRRAGADGPRSLGRYAGRYRFGEFVLEVRCVDGTLWAGWTSTGSPSIGRVSNVGGTGRPIELLQERGHQFFFRSDRFDTALTFEPGDDASIVGVTCRMGQRTERGVRMPSIVA